MFVFRKIRRDLFSCNTRFEIRPFALFPSKSVLLDLFNGKRFVHSLGTYIQRTGNGYLGRIKAY